MDCDINWLYAYQFHFLFFFFFGHLTEQHVPASVHLIWDHLMSCSQLNISKNDCQIVFNCFVFVHYSGDLVFTWGLQVQVMGWWWWCFVEDRTWWVKAAELQAGPCHDHIFVPVPTCPEGQGRTECGKGGPGYHELGDMLFCHKHITMPTPFSTQTWGQLIQVFPISELCGL